LNSENLALVFFECIKLILVVHFQPQIEKARVCQRGHRGFFSLERDVELFYLSELKLGRISIKQVYLYNAPKYVLVLQNRVLISLVNVATRYRIGVFVVELSDWIFKPFVALRQGKKTELVLIQLKFECAFA